jgi:exopolysaccharide biosynthesis polyprenyl glycosylphosphotransferase
MGTVDDLCGVLRRTGVGLVVVVPGTLSSQRTAALVAELEAAGVQIDVVCGLPGLSPRRQRPSTVAGLGVATLRCARKLCGARRLAKRLLDISGALTVLALTAPVTVAVAAAIVLDDRGPVLFRQRRVGRDGCPFDIVKFRTMHVAAESEQAALRAANERTGPLFKLDHDPRVTRVGRLLRATSLDELPQLWNVLRGEMSLVGPRPALPDEVAQFDDRLLDRLRVPPGVTGLWQVQARDNPHFGAYRRLDLFYVDNWSLGLDLMILMSTARHVVQRAARCLRRSSEAVGGAGTRIAPAAGGGVAEQTGDHLEAQRLVGAFEDAEHAGVDVQPADGVFLGVPVATVDLHRLAGRPLGGLADAPR